MNASFELDDQRVEKSTFVGAGDVIEDVREVILDPFEVVAAVTARSGLLAAMAVLALFGWAGWKVYRPVEDCEPGTACAVPRVRKRRQVVFWIALFFALALVTSAYWIPLIV
jgi:hypothetical protein